MSKERCRAITKSGAPCKAAATDNGYCFFHAFPDKARELGRIGGRNRRRSAQQIPAVERGTFTQRLDRLCTQLEDKLIDPPRANAMIKAIELQVRIQEKSAIPAELANLEQALKKTQALIQLRDHEKAVSEYETSALENEAEDDDVNDR
jgi:Family of unknown function (DUF5763)